MTNYKEPFCVLPLRDIVVFPNMIVPLFVGRTKSIKALDFAEKFEKEIFLVAQKDANTDEPLSAEPAPPPPGPPSPPPFGPPSGEPPPPPPPKTPEAP